METFDNYVLLVIVTLPILAAGLLVFVPFYRPSVVKRIATAVALGEMVLSFYVFTGYNHDVGGFQFFQQWHWLEIPGPWFFGERAITLALGVDGISALMVLLTGLVMFTGILVSWTIKGRSKDFFILYLLLLAGAFGVFVSIDLFFMFFFYGLTVLPMYPLIGVWGSSSTFKDFIRTKEYGAMKLTLFLVAGSVLIWITLIATFVEGGIGTFGLMELQNVQFSPTFQNIFFPFLVVGFGVLAGMWPFHTWSPDGHVASPSAVSMVHAGVVMKLGAYGILRVGMTLFPDGAQVWMPVLVSIGAVNVIYGAVAAMGQRDLKYVISYSGVSHMGYVLMGLGTLHHAGISGAVLQMFSHGVMTALFFLVVGAIYDRACTRDIDVLEGLVKRTGIIAWLFLVAGLASLGLPGLSGFVAELLVFIGLFQTYPILGAFGVIGVAVTAVYTLRLIARVFFGQLNEKWGDQVGMSRVEGASALILVGFIVLMGVFPFPFIQSVDKAVGDLIIRIVGAA